MTARELVSSIRSTHKLLSADQSMNDRVILSIAVRNRNMLVNQKMGERKLWQTDGLFTTLCLEMEPVPLSECCDYISECTIARSKSKIPKIAEGIYNYAIQGIYNVETSKKFTEITPARYINVLGLPKVKKETYVWIFNDYVYATNSDLIAVKMSAFFEDHNIPKDILFPECGCGNIRYDNATVCMNPLDRDFKIPGYLIEPLVNATSKYLLQTYHNLAEDRTSNNNDETSK